MEMVVYIIIGVVGGFAVAWLWRNGELVKAQESAKQAAKTLEEEQARFAEKLQTEQNRFAEKLSEEQKRAEEKVQAERQHSQGTSFGNGETAGGEKQTVAGRASEYGCADVERQP